MISATLTKSLRSFNRLVSCSSEPACCSPGIVDLAEAIGPEAAFGLTAALSAARRFTPKTGRVRPGAATPPEESVPLGLVDDFSILGGASTIH
jgi:hypothetical protein